MFKKTLIAAALATTALGAVASTVTVSSVSTLGVEYAAGVEQVTIATVTVDPGRDYSAGDIISLIFSGADVATTTNAATPTPVLPTVGGTLASDIEFLEYAGNEIKFLVTEDFSSTAGTFTVTGIQLDVSDATDAGEVTVKASGKVATVEGPKVVDGSAAADVLVFAQQLDTDIVTPFDGVIDVNTARKLFVGGTRSDTLVLDNTNATVSTGVTTTGITYTVNGDFMFLDADGDGELGGADDGAITSTGGTVTLAEDMQSFTVTSVGVVSDGTVGITVTAPEDTVIPDQSFTASTVMSYTDPSSASAPDIAVTTLAETSAGSWTLNGAKAHIPFLPFGPQYSQAVTVSNTSMQSGGVDLVIYVGDDTVEFEGIATVGPEGVTDLSSAIRSAVASAGLSGNLSMDVVINAPDSAITVEALYYSKADGDRLRTL